MATEGGTVSRAAYFGGIAAGGIILAGGLYFASALAGGWAILLEMIVVGLAMLATTSIWKRSARSVLELDTPSEPRDGSRTG